MANNIINFPKMNVHPRTKKEAQENIIEIRKTFADEMVMDMCIDFFSRLPVFGIHLGTDDLSEKDKIMLSEVIKSLVYRHFGIEHVFQPVIDSTIQLLNNGTAIIEPTTKKQKPSLKPEKKK